MINLKKLESLLIEGGTSKKRPDPDGTEEEIRNVGSDRTDQIVNDPRAKAVLQQHIVGMKGHQTEQKQNRKGGDQQPVDLQPRAGSNGCIGPTRVRTGPCLPVRGAHAAGFRPFHFRACCRHSRPCDAPFEVSDSIGTNPHIVKNSSTSRCMKFEPPSE